MISEPLHIVGIAGPVVVQSQRLSGRYTITVGGNVAPRKGRTYLLPTTVGGAVQATLRGMLFDPYPTLDIRGTRYRTGPTVPLVLRFLIPVPIVLVTFGGALGGLIGATGLVTNLGVARARWSNGLKASLMIVVLVIALIIWMVAANGVAALFNVD